MSKFGSLISNKIEWRGITKTELARRSKCHKNTITHIINSDCYDPKASTVISICEALDISIIDAMEALKHDLNQK